MPPFTLPDSRQPSQNALYHRPSTSKNRSTPSQKDSRGVPNLHLTSPRTSQEGKDLCSDGGDKYMGDAVAKYLATIKMPVPPQTRLTTLQTAPPNATPKPQMKRPLPSLLQEERLKKPCVSSEPADQDPFVTPNVQKSPSRNRPQLKVSEIEHRAQQLLRSPGNPPSEAESATEQATAPSPRGVGGSLHATQGGGTNHGGAEEEATDSMSIVSSEESHSITVQPSGQTIEQTIEANPNISDSELIQQLYDTIQSLQEERDQLHAELQAVRNNFVLPDLPPRTLVLHRVTCDCSLSHVTTIFRDLPDFAPTEGNRGHVKGRLAIDGIQPYLVRNKDIALVVCKEYRCSKNSRGRLFGKDRQDIDNTTDSVAAISFSESMTITSETTRRAFKKVLNNMENAGHYPEVEVGSEIEAPYTFIYHDRVAIKKGILDICDKHRDGLHLLLAYLEESFETKYQEADELFYRGQVSFETFQYLFAPNQVIVKYDGGELVAYYTESYPRKESPTEWRLKVWSLQYDGAFWTERTSVTVKYPEPNDEVVSITDLKVYPLKYASPALESCLRARGVKFWGCRDSKYVCYHDRDVYNIGHNDIRYMIDYEVLKKVRPDALTAPASTKPREYISSGMMSKDSLLGYPKVLLFPARIFGYHMLDKKWVKLRVDGISDVVWNKQAFESLVVDDDTKECVEALVTSQLAAEKSTDLIDGKGNGLVILLHGGPGTGKTLTAGKYSRHPAFEERLFTNSNHRKVVALQITKDSISAMCADRSTSVAELAEKPLYRVTCGDIGTEPDTVEKVPRSQISVTTESNGLVLLDEADVFLEERSLQDLRRNALVSVFLRVLEYYDGMLPWSTIAIFKFPPQSSANSTMTTQGILILTTNRVGTFDEAFKSRIQLSLHYENLTENQRKTIWENFLKRLEIVDEDNVDIDDLRGHVRDLAKHDMNGRQIRNALTTARQLAQYKKKKMDYKHLKHAIKVSAKFDQYLKNVKHGVTDDDIAREGGIRF